MNFSADVGKQFEAVLPERHKCHPVEAIHIASLGVVHRIHKLLPPKASVDLPIFENDLQVGNWFFACFSQTRTLTQANTHTHFSIDVDTARGFFFLDGSLSVNVRKLIMRVDDRSRFYAIALEKLVRGFV